MYFHCCVSKVLQIPWQQSGKWYFQNSRGKKNNNAESALKEVISSTVTNSMADNIHVYQETSEENMLVWLPTSLIYCMVHEFHFSLLLTVELLSNAVPIGFNTFLLSSCEWVLYATEDFRCQDVRSNIWRSSRRLRKHFKQSIVFLCS